MIQSNLEMVNVTQRYHCTHCHATFESETIVASESMPVFCCNGCKVVYDILTQSNLTYYYVLKEKTTPFKAAQPVSDAQKNYTYLDALPTDIAHSFYIEGIHCVACLWLIENLSRVYPGVQSVRLNLGTSTAIIKLSSDGKWSKTAQTLAELGYAPHLLNTSEAEARHAAARRSTMIKIGIAAACAANIMMFSVAIYSGVTGTLETAFQWLSGLLSIPVMAYAAIPFYQGFRAALKSRHMTIDVPVVLAIQLGFWMSFWNLLKGSPHTYFDSITTFVFLMLSTRHALKEAHSRLTHDIDLKLNILGPERDISVGDILVVGTEEVIPCDGLVHSLAAELDTSLMTGETLPTHMKQGDTLYAGMKNVGSPLHIQATAVGAQTRLSRLLSEIESGKKPDIVILTDTISKYFLWVVLGLVGASLLLPTASLNMTLALIVVACPCALALAVPLTISRSLHLAMKRGIWIKNPSALQRLTDIKTLYWDKTGTLTTGQLQVCDWQRKDTDPSLDALIYALEKDSRHPIAKAIVRYLHAKGLNPNDCPILEVVDTIGQGVSATYKGHHYQLSQLKSLSQEGEKKAISQVALFKNGTPCICISLEDTLKPDGVHTLELLHSQGLNSHLLSGDTQAAVDGIMVRLPLKSATAEMSPEDKIHRIQATPYSMMIGDGANDATAMAVAHVSLAVQGSLDLSLKAADMVLVVPELSRIPELFDIARQCKRVWILNCTLALFYNSFGIFSVFMGWVDPLFAAILMPLSSLTVYLIPMIMIRDSRRL